MYTHVYLSPHFDDAPLSCGGTIHQQVQCGEAVLVITICAAPPEPGTPLSPMAAQFQEAMGGGEDVVTMRLREDRAALAVLGTDAVWLGFKDSIYRGVPETGMWYYPDVDAVFGSIHPDEAGRAEVLAEAIGEKAGDSPETTFYAPLGVGGHVDHRHAHRAAWVLKAQGRRVAFYEDYPYADPAYRLPFGKANPAPLDAVLAAITASPLTPQVVYLSDDDLRAKIESVRAYPSQVPLLFGDDAAMEARLRGYALHVGGQDPAERLWMPEG